MISLKMFGPLGDERYEEYITDIQGCGQHLLHHIEGILDAVDLEQGDLELDISANSIGQMVSAALTTLQESADNKAIKFDLNVPEKDTQVQVDYKHTLQLLENIIGNAVKYSDDGGTIFISLRSEDSKNANLSIRDQGIGIAPEKIEESLSYFGVSNSLLADEERGLGLGLAMAKRIMELQKGSLEIHSEEGQGTCILMNFCLIG